MVPSSYLFTIIVLFTTSGATKTEPCKSSNNNNEKSCVEVGLLYLSQEHQKPWNISKIELDSPAGMTSLTREQLRPFNNLQSLKISNSNNLIEKIDDGVFSNLQFLENVTITNAITSVPLAMLDGSFVKYLWLYLNKELVLPKHSSLIESQNLTFLSLASNGIKQLYSETFSQLPELEILYLNNNEFEDLPYGIFEQNPQLKYVSLQEGHLKYVNVDIFSSLKYVNVNFYMNPWDCDCLLYDLMKLAKERKFENFEKLQCERTKWFWVASMQYLYQCEHPC